MKSIKWALAAIVLSGVLSACNKPEPAAPAAAEPMPAPAEPAPAAEPTPVDPAAAEPAPSMPANPPPADPAVESSEDLPHSGGDKVGTAPAPAAPGN